MKISELDILNKLAQIRNDTSALDKLNSEENITREAVASMALSQNDILYTTQEGARVAPKLSPQE